VALRFLNKLIVVLATGLQYYFSTVSRLPVQQLITEKALLQKIFIHAYFLHPGPGYDVPLASPLLGPVGRVLRIEPTILLNLKS